MSDILLVLVVISFAGGIGAFAFLPVSVFYPYLALLLVTAAVFCLTTKTRPHFVTGLILALFFVVGMIHGRQFTSPPTAPHSLYRQIDERGELSLIGTLQEAPAISEEKTTLIMAAEKIVTPGKITPASGLAQISFKGLPPTGLRPGDLFIARGYFARPRRFATPGSFDYPAYLATQKIYTTGWLKSSANISKLPDSKSPGFIRKMRYGPEQIRQRINSFLTTTLPARQAGLYKAILTGDRAAVAPDILENFKKTGCVHLLAISGLHMGLLVLIVTTAIYWLLKRSTWILLHTPAWKIAVLLALPILIFYGSVAGFNIPVVRAMIMTIVLAGAVIFDRQTNLVASIALAALLILIINPAALFSASFQLSFAAVSGLAAVAPILRRKLHNIKPTDRPWRKILKWAIFSLLISTAAMISTAPLAVYHFNRLSLLSPPATLLVEPLLCFWALIIGLAGSCLIFIEPQSAAFIFKIGAWGITGAAETADVLGRLPFCSIWFTTPGILEVCCTYLFLFCLLNLPRHHYFRFAAAGLLLFLIIRPGWLEIRKSRTTETLVSVLDVGQGSAVVMELGNGRTILLDGGGSRSEKFNVGEALIAPFLWQRRISHIDDIIISHPDSDHFNGLPFILERFKPKRLWVNGRPGNMLYEILLRQAAEAGVEIKIPEENSIIARQNDNTLLNLAGLHQEDRQENLADNNHSLILKLQTAKLSFLFPGDIEKEAEQLAVKGNYKLAADIMLAPHHGSKSSSSAIFLAAVRPAEIIISAAARNYGTFPAAQVIERYRRQNIFTMTTGANGTVTYLIRPDKVRRVCFFES